LEIKVISDFDVHKVEAYMLGRTRQFANKKTERKVSVRTVNLPLSYAKTWLRWAEYRNYIGLNPLEKIKPLKGPKNKIRRALSLLETAKILEVCPPAKIEIWKTFLLTGLRHNELSLLTWGDVNLENKTLRIRSETVKTRKERTVPLNEELLKLLNSRAKREKANLSGFVFPNADGKQFSRNNLIRSFRLAVRKASINKPEEVDIHALRVTFASRLAHAGVPIGTVQSLLGHSTPSLTLAVYVKANQLENHKAVEGLRLT
jgi:integrase